jgi:hypothetical protein
MTSVTRKRIARTFMIGALVALAGCTSVPDKADFDPTLFPRQPVEATFDARIAVLADPAAMAMTVTGERVSGGRSGGVDAPVQMPIGRVVHEAALAAFADAFRGGAPAVERAGAEPGVPTVALRVTRYDYRDRLLYVIPLVIPYGGLLVLSKSQLDLQMAFELRLLDVDGAVLWSNGYDSGLRIWEPPKRPLFQAPEKHFPGLVRLTHETALALMRDAARDVGEWLRNERLRERAL